MTNILQYIFDVPYVLAVKTLKIYGFFNKEYYIDGIIWNELGIPDETKVNLYQLVCEQIHKITKYERILFSYGQPSYTSHIEILHWNDSSKEYD